MDADRASEARSLSDEVDVVDVHEIETVGIALLPVAKQIQRVQVLLLAVTHGIHVECQICLVVVHQSLVFKV